MLAFFIIRKKMRICASKVIIASYLLYSVLSLILFVNQKEYLGGRLYPEVKLIPYLFLYILLLMAVYPVIKFDSSDIKRIQRPSRDIITIFFIIYSVGVIILLPYYFANIQEGLSRLILSDAGVDLYQEAHDEYTKRYPWIIGIIEKYIHKPFGDLSALLFFYYLTLKDRKKSFTFFMIVIFVADLLAPIAQGLRTGVTMRLFAIIIAYYLFRPFLSQSILKESRRVGFVGLFFLGFLFLTLTISRLSNSSSNSLAGNIISYVGHANLNFNGFAFDLKGTREGERTIHEFKTMLGINKTKGFLDVRGKYDYIGADDSYFSTFAGDFVIDYGPFVTFIIFLISLFFFLTATKVTNHTVKFHQLILVFFLATVCMQGGFYLFYYSYELNWVIIITFVMYIVCVVDYKKHNKHNYLTLTQDNQFA